MNFRVLLGKLILIGASDAVIVFREATVKAYEP